jgi:hypothetical protein
MLPVLMGDMVPFIYGGAEKAREFSLRRSYSAQDAGYGDGKCRFLMLN